MLAVGLVHVPDPPTEEVFTAPGPARAEGVVRPTYPLSVGGTVVRDLEVRSTGGRIVEVTATSGADVIRQQLETDQRAPRLGKVIRGDVWQPAQDERRYGAGAGAPSSVRASRRNGPSCSSSSS